VGRAAFAKGEIRGRIVSEADGNIDSSTKLQGSELIPTAKIKEMDRRGRPILVGTVSTKKANALWELDKRGIPHQVLNAKHHQREAEIVAQRDGKIPSRSPPHGRSPRHRHHLPAAIPKRWPGRSSRKNIPRGSKSRRRWDKLGQRIEQREQMKLKTRVAAMGGLHIIRSERHEARRIDLQLRGAAAAKAIPVRAASTSARNDLMRIFAGDW